MDATSKKCPSCNQLYNIKPSHFKPSRNIPLFLVCGHSMCETCITNLIKSTAPIECKVCKQEKQISLKDLELLLQKKISLYNIFPIDVFMVGQLALQSMKVINYKENQTENDCYININEPIKSIGANDVECVQCHKSTSVMCEQCDIIICKDCFNTSHKTFAIFHKHVLKDKSWIEVKEKSKCKSHLNMELEFYCKDCSKPVCAGCFTLGSNNTCYSHCIVPINEVKHQNLNELFEILPKVNEVYLRLTKTAVDIGNSLTKLSDETNTTAYSVALNKIDAHFSKMYYSVQQNNDNITQQVLNMKVTEIDSLKRVKNDIAENIKQAKIILKSIESLEPDKLRDMDISSLLEEAKAVTKYPWYLKQLEPNQPVNVLIQEDDYTSLNDYIKLEGNENPEFRLINTEDLIKANEVIPPPPTSIVYPPKLGKDDNGSEEDAYFTTQQPQQFFEDSKELIYVSHIVDPHNFYVYRVSQQSQVQNLMVEFKEAASFEGPSEEYVTEGKIYLVYNKVGNIWQRCHIVSVDRTDANKTIYNVFCSDVGISLAVKIDSLRYIPPARIFSPPPLAINCSLVDCEPILDSWKTDDTVLMQNIIDNKKAVIHIRFITYMPNGSMRLECNLTTFEDGVSVAHAFAFHGRARIPEHMPYPKILGVWEKPKLIISNYDYTKNSTEEVVITHVVSPDSFYVRKLYLQPIYEKLCDELEHVYSLSIKTGTIYLPEESMACIANIEECGLGATWARAIVLNVTERGCVLVRLVDIGAAVQLHCTALRRIRNKYTVHRGFANECHLAGVTCLDKKWSTKSVALLQSFQGKPLDMRIDDNSSTSLGVTLYDKCQLNVICINEKMIRDKCAVSVGLYMFNKIPNADELALTNRPFLNKQLAEPEPKGQGAVLRNQPSTSQKPNDKDLEARDKGVLRFEAKLLNCISPSLLYVSLAHQQELFTKLFKDIQEYYSNRITKGRENWKVGDKCCTIYNQSQTWRRAVILELENENAKVFYSDFGCDETVPVSSLREISQELATICNGAKKCHLHGIKPAEGKDWPSVTKEFFKELLDAYDKVFITRVSNVKNKRKSMPIELWVYHTTEGGALKPKTSEWRCLNHKIIEQGLAIPDKKQIAKKKVTNNGRDEDFSFMNIIGPGQDCLQSVSMSSSKPVKIDKSSRRESQNSNLVLVTDWIPPKPANEFTAMPTHVDGNGVIYLHDIAHKDTLQQIGKALDVHFSTPAPKQKFEMWTVGEPCIALSYIDNRFYRARVLKVYRNDYTCLIHYIDYGNEELVAFKNLKKSLVLYQIPTQAYKCILNLIHPINDRWEPKYLDYIRKTIVGKQCYVKVIGPPIDDVIPIDIYYNNLWFNDHLVDLNMAKYTDESKVVRKYASTQKLQESDEPDCGFDNKRIIYIMYSPYNKTKFKCSVETMHNLQNIALTVLKDDEETEAYDNMFDELQRDVESMPAIDGIYLNKACVAIFPDDDLWYRASILEYSRSKKLVKVKYVDYGNISVVKEMYVKETNEKYAKLPSFSVTASLHGVKVNPDMELIEVNKKYKEIFFDPIAFNAEVIDDSHINPSIELRNNDGQLIYESLIQQNILFKCD